MERRSLTVMRLSRYIKGSTYLQVSQAMMLRADILQAAPKHATEGRGYEYRPVTLRIGTCVGSVCGAEGVVSHA